MNDLEILERIEELEFHKCMKPTQKFLDMINTADRTRPMFTLKECQRLRSEETERDAMRGAMGDTELDDHLNKLIKESEMSDTFEDMNNQELKKFNKPKKETLC